jgi:hypothetical protein
MQKDFQQHKNFHIAPWIKTILIGLLALNIISIVLLASVPPVSRDALTHHLAVPKLYLKHGGIYEIPHIVFSYYPMNIDLLYMIPLYFENDIIPKYIHFTFALLTSFLIFRYLRKRLDSLYALSGVVLFLSLPVILKLSITAYVDLGLVFFSTATLIYLFKWMNNDYKIKNLFIAAVCCGLALGTKYNGLILYFIYTLMVVFLHARHSAATTQPQWKALSHGVVFMLVAAAVFSPWAIRNYHWTHNPLYPLHNRWFNGKLADTNTAMAGPSSENGIEMQNVEMKRSIGGWGPFAIRKIIYKEKWWEIALIPFRIFFQGEDDNPKFFDGRLNPFLLFLPIVAFLNFRRDSTKLRREKLILLLFSSLYVLYAFFQTDMRIRYIAPVIPPLIFLAVMGLQTTVSFIQNRWVGATRQLAFGAAAVLIILLFTLNARYLVSQFHHVKPMSYLSGTLQRDDYITRYRGEYPAIQFINSHVPSTAQLLALGLGNRTYYCDRRMDCDSDFFINAVTAARSADSLATILRSSGYSHLLIRHHYFRLFIYDNMSDDKRIIFDHFRETMTEELFNGQRYQVLEIKDIQAAPMAKYGN